MQRAFMFIDLHDGNGWTPVSDAKHDVAALDSLSVEWGTDTPETQPEPEVMSFDLFDRTGDLAGKSMTLAGCRVLVQLSRQPEWREMPQTTWSEVEGSTWFVFADWYDGRDPSIPDPAALTLFQGIVSTGGSIEPKHGGWLISLHATGLTVLLKRIQRQGPTSGDAKYAGLHWIGTPEQRLDEINSRAISAAAPTLDDGTRQWAVSQLPPQVSAYKTGDSPSLLDLLHRLTAHSPQWPLWYASHEYSTAEHVRAIPIGVAAQLVMNDLGKIETRWNGRTLPALDGSMVQLVNESLSLPDQLTGVVLTCKSAKLDTDGTMAYDDAEIEYGDMGRLPSGLKSSMKTMGVQSDAIISDATGSAVWRPSDADRIMMADLIENLAVKLRPSGIVIDSRNLPVSLFETSYQPSASGPWAFTSSMFTSLVSDDGYPATGGAWLAIGGVLTYGHRNKTPFFRNELTIIPLPRSTLHDNPRWMDMQGITAQWKYVRMTWAEFAQITNFEHQEERTVEVAK